MFPALVAAEEPVLDEEAAYLLTAKEHYKWIERHKLYWQRY